MKLDQGRSKTGKESRLESLVRELLEMQWANSRLGTLVEAFRRQIEASACSQSPPEDLRDWEFPAAESCRCDNGRKAEKLKTLLDRAKYCNYELEVENAQLREEIEGLLDELKHFEALFTESRGPANAGACPFAHKLHGKKVTLVGGIESLECHYRHLIESSGGLFCRHDGLCTGGDHDLEDCILGSDLVVCPLEVNGLDAADSVREICKGAGVRCCFPRSPSITGLRQALQGLYSDQSVA